MVEQEKSIGRACRRTLAFAPAKKEVTEEGAT